MKEQQKLKLRLIRMMEQPFRVHSEDSFDKEGVEAAIMSPIPDHEKFARDREKLQANKFAAPPELRVFYEEPLLTREQEYHLFRQYNYLKHKAKRILQNADPTDPVVSDVENAEKLIAQSLLVKRQLAGSNVRLVMNIAKKQREYAMNPNIDLLAEIVSDGYMGLMRAVDYFDYRLGNKFSTYATWAILDTMKRSRQARLKHASCTTGLDESLYELPDDREEDPSENDTIPITEMLKKMPARQRQVIIEYFGLDGKDTRTLNEIGDSIGISKERVRQLREQGLAKLRTMLNV